MPSYRPSTPDLLRAFLRGRLSFERLRRIASADHERDSDAIALEFMRNLDTGQYSYSGVGNPYECVLLQQNDGTADRSLDALFGAWWLGTFCTDPASFVLIGNLAPRGVDSLLFVVVRGCGGLGAETAQAAHAALPFVSFVRSRTPDASQHAFDQAHDALEALERLGVEGTKTERYRGFMRMFSGPEAS